MSEKFPKKEDVLKDMRQAFRTLKHFVQIDPDEAAKPELPPIYYHLIDYINETQKELDDELPEMR